MCSQTRIVIVIAVTACSSPVDTGRFGRILYPIFMSSSWEVNKVFGECTSITKFYVTSISNTPTVLTSNRAVKKNLTFPSSMAPLFLLNLGVKVDRNKLAVFIFCCKAWLQTFRMNLLSHYSTIKLHCYRRFGRIFCLRFLHMDGYSTFLFHAGNSL